VWVAGLRDGHQPKFYELLFNVGKAREHISARIRTTAGQSRISGADIKTAPVPQAEPGEQEHIVQEAERIISGVERLQAEVHTAKLRSVPQDPSDEPASVLLGRIRSQRATASVERPKGILRPKAAGTTQMMP
jgi:type I restriction enzyme S subunit